MASDYYKVVPASCVCGGSQAWVKLIPGPWETGGVAEEMVGCICHHALPADAKIIGDYLDRPYRDDPMPLFDEKTRTQWKRRNYLRNYGTFTNPFKPKSGAGPG